MMIDDMDLVRQYARSGSEEAFATLVSRHVNMVYSLALRQVRDTHVAEEVTQTVFVILARKARSLNPKTVVPGWLCRTARFVSAKSLTMQRRREHREQEAYMQSQSGYQESEVWADIEPLLDAAMAQLGGKDHDAVVLRFFEGRDFKDVGAALGTTEASAKMRVSRALGKLRKFFSKRGLTFSAAMISGAVSAHSVQAAPVALAGSVTLAAIQGTTITTSTLTLVKTTLTLMAWTKLKTAAVISIVALMAVGTATAIVHHAGEAAKPVPLTFAGYATPEAAIQSMLWAGSLGDFEQFMSACTSDQQERFRVKMAGKSDDDIKREAVAWANALAGCRITRKEIISGQEVHLHIRATPSAEGLHSGKVIVIMKKIGNDWKQAGDL